jgi:hypothetical protein
MKNIFRNALKMPEKKRRQRRSTMINLKNTKEYIQTFLRIKTKDNRITYFVLNDPQDDLLKIIEAERAAGRPVRIIILKARQMGFSTVTEAVIFQDTVTRFNVNSAIITHKSDATDNLFNMTNLFYEELPDGMKPMIKNSNAKALVFANPTSDKVAKKKRPGLRSKIKCFTAGAKGVGRSETITNLHVSEFAFWEGKKGTTKAQILQGVMQAVPNLPGTLVIIESTANGWEEFKEMWDDAVEGISGFIPVFYPWHAMKTYRMKYDGFELTKEEKKLKAKYNLDDEQLTWRRWCIKTNCNNDIDTFKQEYPSCPEEAFITTGNPVFDVQKVIDRIEKIRQKKPLRIGRFEYKKDGEQIITNSIKWHEDEHGEIKIFEEPQKRTPYSGGGDTAGDGSDFFTGIISNNITMNHAATLKHQYDEDLYAEQMYCLGLFYNEALLAPEINYSSHPIKVLQKLGYPNLYRRVNIQNISEQTEDKIGWRTDQVTRPVIIAELVTFVREHVDLINDIEVLREMLNFIKNKDMRPEARPGQHDDLVMGYAINVHIRQYQRMELYEEPEESDSDYQSFLDYGRR